MDGQTLVSLLKIPIAQNYNKNQGLKQLDINQLAQIKKTIDTKTLKHSL